MANRDAHPTAPGHPAFSLLQLKRSELPQRAYRFTLSAAGACGWWRGR